MADSTVPKQLEQHAFKPGQSGNLKGRPKGSRNKLSEDFIAAMQADFMEHGVKVVQDVRCSDPKDYLKIIASILPKQAEIKVHDDDALSPDQLRLALSGAIRDLEAFGIDLGLEDSEGRANGNQTELPGPIQTLQ